MLRIRIFRRSALVFGLASLTTFPSVAGAQPARPSDTQDEARTEALFGDAKALLAAGRAREACPKLEEAKRLAPGGGTLLALAICYEQDARGATAIAAFREALVVALRAKRVERIALAEERIRSLEASVSRLTVTVEDGTADGIDVRVNDVPLARAAWGTPVPVDAGTYLVSAVAPGKRHWEASVRVGALGDRPRVEVARLVDLDVRPAATAALVPVTAPPAAEQTRPTPNRGSPRVAAYVAAGVGVVGAGAGSYFGVRALTLRRDGIAECQSHPCGADGSSQYREAKVDALISTIGLAVGAVGIGTGAFLLLRSHSSASATRGGSSLVVAPSLSLRGGSVAVCGAF